MSYDVECYQLALDFLYEEFREREDFQKLVGDLAHEVQHTIEDFIESTKQKEN